MSASDYLETIQRHGEYFDWALALVPEGTGGSDLKRLPAWLAAQILRAGIPHDIPPLQQFRQLFAKHDWARGQYDILWRQLPSHAQARLALGPHLAIGTVHSAEFNGMAYPVPAQSGDGWIIVIPTGAMLVISAASILLTLHSSAELIAILIRGLHEHLNYTEPPHFQFLREQRREARDHWRHQFPEARVANEFAVIMNRYNALGVADPPDIGRSLPRPLFDEAAKAGHPFEAACAIEFFAAQFLLLHECGHVLLEHREMAPLERHEQEYDADSKALDLALQSARSPASRIAYCLGVTLLLGVANWISRTDPQDMEADHPLPSARRRRLYRMMAERLTDQPTELSTLLSLTEELDSRLLRLWRSSEMSRGFRSEQALDPLLLLLEKCYREHKPEIFQDQFLRWTLFGAPERLCRAVGRTRAALEAASPSEERTEKLKLVMWAYDAASSHHSQRLSVLLDSAYKKESDILKAQRISGQ